MMKKREMHGYVTFRFVRERLGLLEFTKIVVLSSGSES
jgi:hypothetical protein